jgi:exodeoxyribonuclease-3
MIPKDSYPSDVKILRVVSINVNGLRSSVTKGLLDWLEQSDADVYACKKAALPMNNGPINLNLKVGIRICSLLNVQAMQALQFIAAYPLSLLKMVGFELADSQGRFIRLNLI